MGGQGTEHPIGLVALQVRVVSQPYPQLGQRPLIPDQQPLLDEVPHLGWFDWILDFVGIRYAYIAGTWGHAPDE